MKELFSASFNVHLYTSILSKLSLKYFKIFHFKRFRNFRVQNKNIAIFIYLTLFFGEIGSRADNKLLEGGGVERNL